MLYGLNGQLGAGKDEVYRRAKKLLGPSIEVERLSFAEKLKVSAAAAIGIDPAEFETLKRNPHSYLELMTLHSGGMGHIHTRVTVREYLQRYGTEAHREVFGDDFWVDATLPLDFDHSNKVVMVTDARFANEVQRVRELDGKIIRVLNGPLVTPAHASEQILDASLVDYEIDNSIRDDDFANLDNQISEILRKDLCLAL